MGQIEGKKIHPNRKRPKVGSTKEMHSLFSTFYNFLKVKIGWGLSVLPMSVSLSIHLIIAPFLKQLFFLPNEISIQISDVRNFRLLDSSF